MLTPAFEEMNKVCPPTKSGIWQTDQFWYGTWNEDGSPRKAFRYTINAVCEDAMRVLWCAWHLRAEVFLNNGTSQFTTARVRSSQPIDDYGKPWLSWVTCRGRLSSGGSEAESVPVTDILWIGSYCKQTMVPLTEILAIRKICGSERYTALFEADEYQRPLFRLTDGTRKHELQLYYEGRVVATGRSTKFAENWSNRFGGSWVDERRATLIHTGQITREVDVSTGRRPIQLTRGSRGQGNSTDRPPGPTDPRYGDHG